MTKGEAHSGQGHCLSRAAFLPIISRMRWRFSARMISLDLVSLALLGFAPLAHAEVEEIDLTTALPDTGKFEELKIEKSLVIEAKVERPQVQFPLLKEPPPEKEIPFEASFREEILHAPRENTFKLK